MLGLTPTEYAFIGLVFVWGGFVRAGLGFGGAALTLPFLLLVLDNPIHILPVIALHLLFFASLTVGARLSHVDWRFLGKSMVWMLPFKVAGVIGLLNLSGPVLSAMVYAVTAVYAVAYVANFELRSNHRITDGILLALGAYVSGTSLIGAPLIVVVYARHVGKESLRETLFALWILLVSIKIAAFVATDTDLQWRHQLWLLPCAAVGHYLGLKLHTRLISLDAVSFMRGIGVVLLAVTGLGVWVTFFAKL